MAIKLSSPHLSTDTAEWACETVRQARIFAQDNLRDVHKRDHRYIPSHVRIHVPDEASLWHHLTWLRAVGEARSGIHNEKPLGFVKLDRPERLNRNRLHGRNIFLNYIEVTIAPPEDEPETEQRPAVINRLVLVDRKMAPDDKAVILPLARGGDIRIQPKHAMDIFASMQPC